MKKPILLDLFCCAGGAARGYADAGFDVVGVDIAPQPHYPYPFIQADALEYLTTANLSRFSAIHASPPCQGYTRARHIQGREHPMLIDETRKRLCRTGLPWVIENVEDAPMPHYLMLCGTHFGLRVYRHRQFETSHMMFAPGPCSHPHALLPGYVCIYGDVVRGTQKGHTGNHYQRYGIATGRAAMGIDWKMSQRELSECIPPAYTQYIGQFLMQIISPVEALA